MPMPMPVKKKKIDMHNLNKYVHIRFLCKHKESIMRNAAQMTFGDDTHTHTQRKVTIKVKIERVCSSRMALECC